MLNNIQKITTFTQLIVWQKAHQLVLRVYQLTGTFPKNEQFGITDQMRRCAVSITSNIAEGFSRQGNKEKTQFYYISRGSLTELQNQLLVARDIHYIKRTDFDNIAEQTVEVHKILNGLIKSQKLEYR